MKLLVGLTNWFCRYCVECYFFIKYLDLNDLFAFFALVIMNYYL